MGLSAQLEGALEKFFRRDVGVYYSQVPLDKNNPLMFEQNEDIMEEKWLKESFYSCLMWNKIGPILPMTASIIDHQA